MAADLFRIRDHLADFDAIVEDIVAASARTRDTVPMKANVPYGDGPSETVDIFFPEGPRENLPVHMFIHGGYWRMFSKADYSNVANTVTAAGAIAVIIDYALMPHFRMTVLVDQAIRARQWILDHIHSHGGDPLRLTVSGHSAGAHLATFLLHKRDGTPAVRGALLLGGLYDLQPLQNSFLSQEIALTDEEILEFTPLRYQYDYNCRVVLAVGENETLPFHSQYKAFSDLLRKQGVPTTLEKIKDRNHMDSVRDLGIAGSEASNILASLICGETPR